MAAAHNIDEQMHCVRALMASIMAGLIAKPGWAAVEAAGPAEMAANRIDNAVRRVILSEMDAMPEGERGHFVCALANVMGAHVGMLLRSLPPELMQVVLQSHSETLLRAAGADLARSGVCVTVSTSDTKEPVH